MDKEGKLKLAIVLCFVFMAIEVAGGLVSGSLAILTDAAHLLTDVVGFIMALMAVYIARWKASSKYTFGEYIGVYKYVWVLKHTLFRTNHL